MKRIKKIVAVSLACVMAMTGLVACGKNPKETVMDSFATLTAGASGQGFMSELGITDIMEGLEKKPYTVGMKLALDETNDSDLAMLKSGSVFAEIACDIDKKKALLDLGVGYGGSDLVSGQLYFDEEQLAVAVPELLDKVFYIEFDNIIENFKNSVLMDMMEVSDEDIKMLEDALELMEGAIEDANSDEMMDFLLGFEEEVEEFKEEIEVEEIDAEEFEINGKDRKCDGYEVIITKESIVDFIEAAMDYYFLSDEAKDFYESLEEQVTEAGGVADMEELYDAMEEIESNKEDILAEVESYISDIETEMYIYEGEIVSLEAEMEITDPSGSFGDENVNVGIELECTGGEYSVYDNYELSVKVMGMTVVKLEKESDNDDDEYAVEWKVSGMALEGITMNCSFSMDKADGDYKISAVFDDGYDKMSVTAEGTIEVEKKKSVNIVFDDLTFVYEDLYWEETNSVSLSGEYYVECDADISMPKGDKFNVLTDKESDWEKLMEEAEDMMETLNNLMGSIY